MSALSEVVRSWRSSMSGRIAAGAQRRAADRCVAAADPPRLGAAVVHRPLTARSAACSAAPPSRRRRPLRRRPRSSGRPTAGRRASTGRRSSPADRRPTDGSGRRRRRPRRRTRARRPTSKKRARSARQVARPSPSGANVRSGGSHGPGALVGEELFGARRDHALLDRDADASSPARPRASTPNRGLSSPRCCEIVVVRVAARRTRASASG